MTSPGYVQCWNCYHDVKVPDATQRIRDLEREVERLKPFEAKAERWFAEIEQRETDRADAARFRWLVANGSGNEDKFVGRQYAGITAYWIEWSTNVEGERGTADIRALIDADRAEEGGAATCAENAQVRSDAAMAKDPQP